MSWVAVAIGGSAVLGTAGGIYAANKAGGKETNPEDYLVYKQLPDYSEATGARENWWKTLQDWGASGNYGASDMNWDEIFNTAKDKLSRYYWGSALTPGLAGKVKASAARRNVSQSPALENTLGALGMQESQDLSSLYSDLTTQKANYTESARKNWLSSLMNLSQLKPSYITTANATQPSSYDTGNMISDISSGGSKLLSQYAQYQWLQKLYDSQNKNTIPGVSQSSISSTPDLSGMYPNLFGNTQYPEPGSF